MVPYFRRFQMSHAPQPVNSAVFLTRFEEVEDPRQAAKVICPLEEILLPVPGAVISGARGWTSVSPALEFFETLIKI